MEDAQKVSRGKVVGTSTPASSFTRIRFHNSEIAGANDSLLTGRHQGASFFWSVLN